jgi:signal transduction histidine kinase
MMGVLIGVRMSKLQASNLWQVALRAFAIAAVVLWAMVVADVAQQVGRPFPGFRCEEGLSVSPQTNPAWHGPRHGLLAYDYLLSANGHRLARVGELKAIVASVPPGAPITYEVWRQGRVVQVSVPTQVLSARDALESFGPVLAVGLLHMLIGVGAFWLRPANPAAQALLLLTLVIGLCFQTLGVDFTLTHRFGRFYQAAVHLSGSVLLHLALLFPAPWAAVRRWPWLGPAVYGPSVVMAVWQFAVYDPIGLAAKPGGVEAPLLDGLFVGWAVWSIIGALGLILRAAWVAGRGERLATRQQGRLVLAGTVLAFTPGALGYLLPVLAGQTAELSLPLVIASQAALAFFPLAIALAVLRYHLFEIDVWIKRTVAYTLALGALVGIYAAVLLTAGLVLGGYPVIARGLAALLVGLACVPVFHLARRVLDRLFFRAPYDFQEVATRFSDGARRLLAIEELVAFYGRTVEDALHPDYLLVLVPGNQGGLVVGHRQGRVPAGLDEAAGEAAIARTLQSTEPYVPIPMAWADSEALVLACTALDGQYGAVVLGPRKSDLNYTPPDRRLVIHLSQQLAVFCQNALLFARLVRRNEELAQANAELTQLDGLKRQFLNAVSHELRTPLSSVVGFGEFLHDEVGGPLTPLQQEFVHHIRAGARRLNGLVDDLLDFAQMEAGTFRIMREWSDMRACVEEALDSLRPQALEKGVRLEAALPDGECLAYFDPARFEQVVLNLVGNALKFTPEGGVVRVTLAEHGSDMALQVSDTGIGMPPEVLPRLFDRFFQVDPSTTRRFGGTGLGLAIARAIVEAHGGRIAVTSEPGAGSTFTVLLARAEEAASSVADAAASDDRT